MSELPYSLTDYLGWSQEAETIGRRGKPKDVWVRRYGLDVAHLVTHIAELEAELASMTERSLSRGEALREIGNVVDSAP